MEMYNGKRVALGLSNNVDYEITWNTAAVEALMKEHALAPEDVRDYESVGNERELLGSILHCMRAGQGREIYIRSIDLVERFSARFERRVTMGGTGIRAAIAMDRMGKGAAIHLITMNAAVRQQLPKRCDFICSNREDSFYPHLIVQYKAGTRLRAGEIDVCAPAPNRIIYTNDPDSTNLPLNEDYAALIRQARIFLISGFNVIVDQELLDARIDALMRIMNALPQDALTYCESGCFFKEAFFWRVIERLRARIDIFSMNEEEMQQLLRRSVNLLDAEDMEAAMRDLKKIIDVPYVLVHAHCWALTIGAQAERFQSPMKNAVLMATTRFRFGDGFTPDDFHSTDRLPVAEDVSLFAQAIKRRMGDEICCVPVPTVTQSDVTTIGLGDSFVGGFMLDFA